MAGWRLGHRPALDGLRGVAILLVLVHHSYVPGTERFGMLGVTLFFTLSGFLITALLLEERERTGRISLKDFYIRRARRLLPALFVMVAFCVAVATIVGGWFADIGLAIAVLGYVANWVPATGGFLKALGATWTLGIEEQFYLAWPLLVLIVRRHLGWICALLTTTSITWGWVLLIEGSGQIRVMVGTDTAGYILLAGAALAFFRLRGSPGRVSPRVALAALAALGVVVPMDYVEGVMVGIPVATVAGIAALWACTGTGSIPWLEGRVLRWLGSRSYGIYLWHAPILWGLHTGADWGWLPLLLVAVPASLLIAEASYRWVERPFRARSTARATAQVHAATTSQV